MEQRVINRQHRAARITISAPLIWVPAVSVAAIVPVATCGGVWGLFFRERVVSVFMAGSGCCLVLRVDRLICGFQDFGQ
jgi:hypothetical protein